MRVLVCVYCVSVYVLVCVTVSVCVSVYVCTRVCVPRMAVWSVGDCMISAGCTSSLSITNTVIVTWKIS